MLLEGEKLIGTTLFETELPAEHWPGPRLGWTGEEAGELVMAFV